MTTTSKTARISWQTSLALDILRLSAALLVFLSHGFRIWFTYVFDNYVDLAHFSVIIFFVLSGYLIAYTTSNSNKGVIHYAQSRLGRLYSVLLPAILITALIQLIVYYVDPTLNAHYTRSPIIVRYFISTFFLNDIWFFSASPPINGSLWSLSYEFAYYAIFGVWFFLKKSRNYYLFLILALATAGPSILVMMPIWIMGCIAYKIPSLKVKNIWHWCLFVLSLTCAILVLRFMPGLPFSLGTPPLHYANQFLTDLVLGFFVALALYSISGIQDLKKQPDFIKTFRKIADLTFPLYLLHFPLIVLWKAFIPFKQNNIGQFVLAMTCVILVVAPVGYFLESKRKWWDIQFGILLNALNRKIKTRNN